MHVQSCISQVLDSPLSIHMCQPVLRLEHDSTIERPIVSEDSFEKRIEICFSNRRMRMQSIYFGPQRGVAY